MEAKSAWAIVHWIRYESVKKHLAEGFIMHEKSGNASLEHLNTAQSSENLFFTCWGLEFDKYSQILKSEVGSVSTGIPYSSIFRGFNFLNFWLHAVYNSLLFILPFSTNK